MPRLFWPAAAVALACAVTAPAARREPPGEPPPAREAPASAAEPSAAPPLLALLYVREDSTGRRGEIYPVAWFDGAALVDAAWPPDGEPFALEAYGSFTVYADGASVGTFAIERIETAEYACTETRVGAGDPAGVLAAASLDPDDPRVDAFYAGRPDGSYEYRITYLLALSEPVEQRGFGPPADVDPARIERLREAVRSAGADTVRATDARVWERMEETGRTRPALEEFAVFDLDRDGRLEATGRVAATATMEFRVTEEAAETHDDEVHLRATAWLGERPGGDPELLFLDMDAQTSGSWGEGLERIEVLDLDGDGRAEVVYEWSGWEANRFDVYALESGRLERIFAGAGWGC